ncbi:ABC transporter permease [Aliikangiella coralliicola]|uniref:ABC transporter permease n=1 Tax=Aliikangiella coralliicola TaxID=2592383 RepID=A0A545U6E1_9GAMM|nr:ABC transporter permease [Aliikangiella coralliicola]TQV84973.1 ABC transporter permease [Aliikangiella coralliicola]
MNGIKHTVGIMITVICITILAFGLIRLTPGDPVLLMIGERGSDPIQYQKVATQLGLDKSITEQYQNFLSQAVQGNFGTSVVSSRPVKEELLARWPATIELGLFAMLLSLLIGIPAGIIAAVYRRRIADYVVTISSLVGYSMPIFWWGLVLILIFSVTLDLTPVSGRLDILYDIEPHTGFMLIDSLLSNAREEYQLDAFASALHHLLLPGIVMATVPIAVFARITRSSMLEVLSEDYIRTARAKGLSEFRVIMFHAFRNALIPIITIGGLFFVSTVVAGAILTETIFGWPGIGNYIVSSVYARDYPVIQACILVIGMLVIIVNMTTEYLYRLVNPRMRH